MTKTYIQKIDGSYYAFAGDASRDQVNSIGTDKPAEGTWFAKWTDAGIKYVASPSPSRDAAYRKARRAASEIRPYGGEIK